MKPNIISPLGGIAVGASGAPSDYLRAPMADSATLDPLQLEFGSPDWRKAVANDVRPPFCPSIFDPAAYDFDLRKTAANDVRPVSANDIKPDPWPQAWDEAFKGVQTQPRTLYPLTGVFSIDHLVFLGRALRWLKSIDRNLTLEALKPELNRSRNVTALINSLAPSQRHAFKRVYAHLQRQQRRLTEASIVPYLEHQSISEGILSQPPHFPHFHRVPNSHSSSTSPDPAFLVFQHLVMTLYGRAVPESSIPRDKLPLHVYLQALQALKCPQSPRLRVHFSFHEGTGFNQLSRSWKPSNPKINPIRHYLITVLQENDRWRYVFVSHTSTHYGVAKPYEEIHLFDPTQPNHHLTMPLAKFAGQWGQAFMQCYRVTMLGDC